MSFEPNKNDFELPVKSSYYITAEVWTASFTQDADNKNWHWTPTVLYSSYNKETAEHVFNKFLNTEKENKLGMFSKHTSVYRNIKLLKI